MSNTMEIFCDDCKEKLWYGQTSNGKRYSYRDDSSHPLVAFLEKHEYCSLHCENAYAGEHDTIDTSNYKGFGDE